MSDTETFTVKHSCGHATQYIFKKDEEKEALENEVRDLEEQREQLRSNLRFLDALIESKNEKIRSLIKKSQRLHPVDRYASRGTK